MLARDALRTLAELPAARLGPRAGAWKQLLAVLPALLRMSSTRVLDAVGRVDVLSAFDDPGTLVNDDPRIERALVALWLGLAGNPDLHAPLTLPGPFRVRCVDPRAPRVLALDRARAVVATARGPLVTLEGSAEPLDVLVVDELPVEGGTLLVTDDLHAPDEAATARTRVALAAVRNALPGSELERVTIGLGDHGGAVFGEARVDAACEPGDLVASAHTAFVEAATRFEPLLTPLGSLVEQGRRLTAAHVLARACGRTAALPWRANRDAAAAAVLGDLDDLAVIADPMPAATGLLDALKSVAGGRAPERRRALLVNVDHDDFVYSHLFGRSIERRCAERGLRTDRIDVEHVGKRDLPGELGGPVPMPIADGVEILIDSEADPALTPALGRLATRRYEVVVANVRPRLFYELEAAGIFRVPSLLWSRHLQTGLREERARRGRPTRDAQHLPIRIWGLLGNHASDLHPDLVEAGLIRGVGRHWPLDLEFFQSTAAQQPGRVFAGGDSGRDWPTFVEAVRPLTLDVQLVTSRAPDGLPSHVRVDTRLPLWRFRDALAAASIAAIPLLPSAGAAGITVLPMAMLLGVAIVSTRTRWVEQYVSDGEEGLLVPAGDVAAFRAALTRLHEDSELRARLGANARRRAIALCDLDAFTREMFATLG